MSNLIFAPGETNISEADFSPSLLLFWLKTEMAVTNRRVVAKHPNTLLGAIPLGYQEVALPLNNVASAGASIRFSLLRAIFGALFAIGGLGALGQSAAGGLLLFLIGASLLANAASATLVLVNNGGGVVPLRVSVLERRKLEHFRDEINSRLFIDNDGLRHNEVMGAHQLSVLLQHQQLQAMQNQYPGQSTQQSGPPQVQGQPWPGQQGQPWQGQQGQPWPGQQGQPWQGQQGQPWPAQQGQPWPAQQGQPWPGQQGQTWPGQQGQPWQTPQGQPAPQTPTD